MGTDDKPLVSIICVTYNQKHYVEQMLNGFLCQQVDFPIEIIVHDDASTDGTQEIISKYANENANIKPLLETENQFSQGNDEFVRKMYRMARGKYIALCEGDDYWTDTQKLRLQVDFLEKHPDYALCFHPVEVIFENKVAQDYIYPKGRKVSDFTVKSLLNENFIHTNSVMYRRQNYENVPRHVVPADWYYNLYHAQFGKIGFINRVMAVYRRHEGGIWWARDEDVFWRKNGLTQLEMHQEVLKLYQGKGEYVTALQQPITNAFSSIAALEVKSDQADVLLDAVSKYPMMATNFIRDERKKTTERIQSLEELLSSKEEHIKKLDKVVREQLEYIGTLEKSMNDIAKSRRSRALDKIKGISGRLGQK